MASLIWFAFSAREPTDISREPKLGNHCSSVIFSAVSNRRTEVPSRPEGRPDSHEIPQCFTKKSEALPLVGNSEPRVFFGPRLQTSMTRATVEDSAAGLVQILRTGRPLVGGLSFHGVWGLCTNPVARRPPRGIQAQDMRRRPMQAWVSRSGSGTTACDPHANGWRPVCVCVCLCLGEHAV